MIKRNLFIFLFALLISSCSMFNVSVRDFFEDTIASVEAARSKSEENMPSVLYVSSSGKAGATGTKNDPFASFDEALTKLKEILVADSTLTEGKVYLKSDINITKEISVQNYKFAEVPNNRKITIAGYEEARTINANANCRIMEVGWTDGDFVLENLNFIGGKPAADDINGGAGLFLFSEGANGKTFTIKDCTFKNNESSLSGAALSINSTYNVIITDSEISGNKLNGVAGAAGIEAVQKGTSTSITISNTKITDNIVSLSSSVTSYKFGCAINGSAYTKLAGGVTITGNKIKNVPATILSADDNLCAVYNTLGLKLSGNATIKNNAIEKTDGSSSVRNLILPYSSSSIFPKLSILGSLNGSSIGVSILADSITTALPFTSSYSTSGTTDSPESVFVSDCDFSIAISSGEVAFVTCGGSGSIENPLNITMTFAVSPVTVAEGEAATITVTPSVKNNGTDITSTVLDDISWNLILKSGLTTVKESTSNTLTLTASEVFEGGFTLYILATLNGFTYDDSKQIVCE